MGENFCEMALGKRDRVECHEVKKGWVTNVTVEREKVEAHGTSKRGVSALVASLLTKTAW